MHPIGFSYNPSPLSNPDQKTSKTSNDTAQNTTLTYTNDAALTAKTGTTQTSPSYTAAFASTAMDVEMDCEPSDEMRQQVENNYSLSIINSESLLPKELVSLLKPGCFFHNSDQAEPDCAHVEFYIKDQASRIYLGKIQSTHEECDLKLVDFLLGDLHESTNIPSETVKNLKEQLIEILRRKHASQIPSFFLQEVERPSPGSEKSAWIRFHKDHYTIGWVNEKSLPKYLPKCEPEYAVFKNIFDTNTKKAIGLELYFMDHNNKIIKAHLKYSNYNDLSFETQIAFELICDLASISRASRECYDNIYLQILARIDSLPNQKAHHPVEQISDDESEEEDGFHGSEVSLPDNINKNKQPEGYSKVYIDGRQNNTPNPQPPEQTKIPNLVGDTSFSDEKGFTFFPSTKSFPKGLILPPAYIFDLQAGTIPLELSIYFQGTYTQETADKLIFNSDLVGSWMLFRNSATGLLQVTYLTPHDTVSDIYLFRSYRGQQLQEKDLWPLLKTPTGSRLFKWQNIINHPLRGSPFCNATNLSRLEIEAVLEKAPKGSWCYKKSQSCPGQFVISYKKNDGTIEHKITTASLDQVEIRVEDLIRTYSLKAKDYVRIRLRTPRSFSFNSQQVKVIVIDRENIFHYLKNSKSPFIIRRNSYGEYQLFWLVNNHRVGKYTLSQDQVNRSNVSLNEIFEEAKANMDKPKPFEQWSVWVYKGNAAEKQLNQSFISISQKQDSKYQGRIIFSLDKIFADAVAARHFARYRNEQKDDPNKIITLNTYFDEKWINRTRMICSTLTLNSHITLIGHCSAGSSTVSSRHSGNNYWEFTAQTFAKLLVQNAPHLLSPGTVNGDGPKLHLSVMACSSAASTPQSLSYVKRLTIALFKENIPAIVAGYTTTVKSHERNRNQKKLTKNYMGLFEHRSWGTKRASRIKNFKLIEQDITGDPQKAHSLDF